MATATHIHTHTHTITYTYAHTHNTPHTHTHNHIQLCSIGAQNAMNQHPLVLAASSRYLGNFASVLNDCCR